MEGPNAFGIMFKGKSIEIFGKYSKKFNDCFIVNNFDKEMIS